MEKVTSCSGKFADKNMKAHKITNYNPSFSSAIPYKLLGHKLY